MYYSCRTCYLIECSYGCLLLDLKLVMVCSCHCATMPEQHISITTLTSMFSLNSVHPAVSKVFVESSFWSHRPHKQMRTSMHSLPYAFQVYLLRLAELSMSFSPFATTGVNVCCCQALRAGQFGQLRNMFTLDWSPADLSKASSPSDIWTPDQHPRPPESLALQPKSLSLTLQPETYKLSA